jgi:hypothetical protein
MTTTNVDELGRRLEEVLREHLAASRRAASDAIARAFEVSRVPGRSGRAVSGLKAQKYRSSTEISSLGDALYRAVCAKPGETMMVIAADLGSTPKLLQRPMHQLKGLGRVRSIGQRNMTRYFPLVPKS